MDLIMTILFILLWLLSPIVLLILYIVEISRRKSAERERDLLRLENTELRKRSASSAPNVAASVPINEKPAPAVVSEPSTAAVDLASEKPEAANPQAAAPQTANPQAQTPQNTYTPYNMPYAAYTSALHRTPAQDDKPKEKKERHARTSQVSTINILFIIGALFIIISGLIFATTTWQFLSSGVRAVIIFSFAAVFFAASSLAERKFKLEKTGLLFYTLGSVFLPITLVAAGYFRVFGDWFSVGGDGKFLLYSITSLSLAAVCFKGSIDYADKKRGGTIFAMVSLLSISGAVGLLVWQIIPDADIFALCMAIYSLAVMLAGERLSKLASGRFEMLLSQLPAFTVINTIALSLSVFWASLVRTGGTAENAICAVAGVVFAISYMRGSFTSKNAYLGTVPFMVFIACAAFCLAAPKSYNGVSLVLVAVCALPAIMLYLNVIPEKIRVSLEAITRVLTVCSVICCLVAVIFTEASWISLAAYVILAAEILLLGFRQRGEVSGKFMLSVFPAACSVIVILLSRLVFTDDANKYRYLFAVGLIMALQALFVFIPKLRLRTNASDCIFAAAAVIAELVAVFSEPVAAADIIGVVIATAAVTIPSIKAKNGLWALYTSSAMCAFAFMAVPIEAMADNPALSCFIPFAVLTALTFAAIAFEKRTKKTAVPILAAYLSIGTVYFFAIYSTDFSSIIVALAAAAMLLYGYLRRSKVLFCSGIVSVAATALFAIYNIFESVTCFGLFATVAIAATAIYFINEYTHGDYFKRSVNLTARLLLITAVTVMTFDFLFDYEAHSGQYYYLALMPFVLLCIIQAYSAENTMTLIPIGILVYPVMCHFATEYLIDCEAWIVLFTFALTLVMLVPSGIFHRKAVISGLSTDIWAFTRFIGILAVQIECTDKISEWSIIFLLFINIISLCRTEHSTRTNKCIFTAAMFMPVIAWQTQPFFEKSENFALELNILPVLIYFTAIQFLWQDHKKAAGMVTFAVYCVSYLALFTSALDDGTIANGLIIMITSLAMLIFSFAVKKKKWFILSVGVILIAGLFMSRSFWRSIAWWVYLLVSGLLLIGIGVLNEIKKQNTEKNEIAEKITRFMSEWTW